MENMLYHSAVPEATQATYGEFNNVDFVLNVGPGRSLMRNSVRLNGDVKITTDGTTRPAGGVYMDYAIGIHSVVESCQVSFGTSGTKENIQNYARWCKMGAIGTLYEDDYNNASQQVELRAVNEVCAGLLAQGEVTLGTTPVTDDMDFSMKPNCILNKMSGDHLPVEKSGEIRLTLNLARSMSALMGDNQGIRRLQFEFNDSTNKYVSYNENDLGGMIQRYIESFDNTGHQQMKLDTFRANNGFGVGQKFSGFTDLSNQRFGIQLTSDINNTKPMNIYMYFHSIVQA